MIYLGNINNVLRRPCYVYVQYPMSKAMLAKDYIDTKVISARACRSYKISNVVGDEDTQRGWQRARLIEMSSMSCSSAVFAYPDVTCNSENDLDCKEQKIMISPNEVA